MITIFEKIPDLFVEVYDSQFATWAREFRRRGTRCAIVFHPVPGEAPKFDGEGRLIAAGAWMDAQVDLSVPERPRIVIRPATEHDEEMIARHTRAMSPHWLQ
jgi:hypothetical protein